MPFSLFETNETLAFAFCIALALALVWVFQFVHLMSLDDEAFPGQHTRLGWVAAFLVLWMIAPFAFMIWRRVAHRAQQQSVLDARRRAARSKTGSSSSNQRQPQ